jgi:predicted DNA-binding transcriptional regulator AlpA
MTVTTEPADPVAPRRLHLDKRAAKLAAELDQQEADPDQLLATQQVAAIIGMSDQWLEAGRVKGYGPPYVRLAARIVRYKRSDLRAWLKERARTFGGVIIIVITIFSIIGL